MSVISFNHRIAENRLREAREISHAAWAIQEIVYLKSKSRVGWNLFQDISSNPYKNEDGFVTEYSRCR